MNVVIYIMANSVYKGGKQMKINAKRIVQLVVSVMIAIIVSYSIASVVILGSIKTPYNFENDSYLVKSFTQKKILKKSSGFNVISDTEIKTTVDPFSRVRMNYGNKREDKTGYFLLDVELISEENVTVRICTFKKGEVSEVTYLNINEGLNICEIPLEDATSLRFDFIHSVPVSMQINELTVSNQLIGILPAEWYLCFALCLLLCIEVILVCFAIEIKLQKKLVQCLESWWRSLCGNVKKLAVFVMEHKLAFSVCLAITVFAYAYNLFNFSLGLDEERDIVRSLGTLENVKELLVREGRYGLYFYRVLETVDGSFTAFVAEFLSVVFIFMNIVIAIKCFDVVTKGKIRNSAIVIFGGMFATLPFINAEIMCYSIMNAGVYFSMLLTTTALLLVARFYDNKVRSYLLWALGLTVFAMLCTEAHNVWFITGTVLINLVWVMARKETKWLDWFKYVLHYAITFIVAFVACTLIRSAIGQNGYAGGYIRWGNAEPSVLIQAIFEWIEMILTSKTIPGALYLGLGLLTFIGFILIYVIKEKGARGALVAILSVCFVVAPFMLCFVAGSKMPYRTMEALILLEGGVWFVVINFIDKKVITRYVLVLAAVSIIWNQGVWMNRIFYGADLNSKLDMEMGYAIGEEIEKVANTTQVDKPVAFVGYVQHTSPAIHKLEAVGQSVFNRNQSKYSSFYLRYLGYKFQHASDAQVEKAKELAEDMSVWPLEGSVKEFDDIIVVRLN